MAGCPPGRFTVDEVVARGLLARACRARLATVDRPVLLLELHPPGTLTPAERQELIDRFLERARRLTGLRQAGVAPPIDAGRTPDGGAYVAFDRPDLAGCEPLGDPPRRREWRAACGLAIRLCRALAGAEEQGCLTDRLHPRDAWAAAGGGIIWTALDTAGLARAVGLPPELVESRPDLDAPEATGGGKVDFQRALVFSVSSWLYRSVAGSVAPAPGEALRSGRRPEPLWALVPQCPAVLDDLVQRGLDPAPGRRFRNVAELAAALEAVPGLPLDAPPPARPPAAAALPHAAGSLFGPFWELVFPLLCVTVAAASLGYLSAILIR